MYTVSVESERARIRRWLTYAGLWPRDGPQDTQGTSERQEHRAQERLCICVAGEEKGLQSRTCKVLTLLDNKALQAVRWLVTGLASSTEVENVPIIPIEEKGAN